MLITVAHRSIFDTDNIDIGPERRHYLDHQLKRVWEVNCQVCAEGPHSFGWKTTTTTLLSSKI